MREVSFPAGSQIFGQGDPVASFFVVVSGRVKLTRVTSDGHETILCMLGPGGCLCPLPLLDSGSQLGMAQAVVDSRLLSIGADDFREFCRNTPQLTNMMVATCLQEMRGMVERLESLAHDSLRKRLARLLLDEGRPGHIDDAVPDEIHLTQYEMAQLVGSSRESVSHLLLAWEREDWLSLKRRRVTIRRRDAIEQIATGS
jgi:CRP-like cAMP-binding protein